MSWVSRGFVLRKTEVNVNLTKYVEPITGTVAIKTRVTNLCENLMIVITKGDSHTFEVTIYDDLGAKVDLTGFEVRFSVKVDANDPTYIIQKKNLQAGGSSEEIDMTDPVNGTFEIYIKKEDTEPLRGIGDNYVYDIEYRLGDLVKTPIKGDLIFDDDVSR